MIMEILWPKSRGVFSKVLLKTIILSRPCCRTPFIFYLTLRIFSLGKHVTKAQIQLLICLQTSKYYNLTGDLTEHYTKKNLESPIGSAAIIWHTTNSNPILL